MSKHFMFVLFLLGILVVVVPGQEAEPDGGEPGVEEPNAEDGNVEDPNVEKPDVQDPKVEEPAEDDDSCEFDKGDTNLFNRGSCLICGYDTKKKCLMFFTSEAQAKQTMCNEDQTLWNDDWEFRGGTGCVMGGRCEGSNPGC